MPWKPGELPPVPDGRIASASLSDTQDGGDVYSNSTNSTISGDDLDLASGSNSLSWGIWEFHAGQLYPMSCEVVMSVPAGQEAWIAVANFETGAWEFDGPLTVGKQFALEHELHKSAGGISYVAVITYGGNTATVGRVILNIRDGWEITLAQSATNLTALSAAIVEGMPAMAMLTTSDSVYYSQAQDNQGSAWDTRRLVAGSVSARDHCSLAVVNGNPAISYYDTGSDDLMYVRATDTSGDGWGGPVIAAAGGDSGKHNTLLFAGGRPIIAHFQVEESYLACARPEDANGDAWQLPRVIDNDGVTGLYTSMGIFNGIPCVSYRSDEHLRYSHSETADGDQWMHSVTIDDTATAGLFTSLAMVAGYPAIAYQVPGLNQLRYVRSYHLNGANWESPVVVNGTGNPGTYASLCEIDGMPAIAYQNSADRHLYYVQALDADGSAWPEPVVVDDGEEAGYFCCLMNIDGNPAIAYHQPMGSTVEFALRRVP